MKQNTAVLVLAASIILLFSCPAIAGWNIETVDPERYIHFPSIVVDSNDRPSIAYTNSWTYEVNYASKAGGSWSIDTVDYAQPNGMRYTSLSLDSSNRPHIGYKSDQNSNITHAYNNGTSWELTPLQGSAYSYYTSIAVDSDDNVHMAYSHVSNSSTLKYALNDGTGWQISTLSNEPWSNYYTSLALNSLNRPAISYYDTVNDDLKYASFNGSSWDFEVVDSAGDVGLYTTLAIDSMDRPHIAYLDYTDFAKRVINLKYAYFDGSSWNTQQIEQIDNSCCLTNYTMSIKLDSNDVPYLAYHNRVSGDIKYGRMDETGWHFETLDNNSMSGVSSYVSLAFDSADNPHIAYMKDATLVYATTVVPEPVSSVLFITGGTALGIRRFWKKKNG